MDVSTQAGEHYPAGLLLAVCGRTRAVHISGYVGSCSLQASFPRIKMRGTPHPRYGADWLTAAIQGLLVSALHVS